MILDHNGLLPLPICLVDLGLWLAIRVILPSNVVIPLFKPSIYSKIKMGWPSESYAVVQTPVSRESTFSLGVLFQLFFAYIAKITLRLVDFGFCSLELVIPVPSYVKKSSAITSSPPVDNCIL